MDKVTDIPSALKPNGPGLAVTSAKYIADTGAEDSSTVDETLRRLEKGTGTYHVPAGKKTTEYTVGNLKKGTSVNGLEGKSVSEILNLMLFGTLYPSITNPSVYIYFTDEKGDINTSGDTVTAKESIPEIHYNYTPGYSELDGVQTKYSGDITAVNYVWRENGNIIATPPVKGKEGSTYTVQLELTVGSGSFVPVNSDGKSVDAEGKSYKSFTQQVIKSNTITFKSSYIAMIWFGDDDSIPEDKAVNVGDTREIANASSLKNITLYGEYHYNTLLCTQKEASNYFTFTAGQPGYVSNRDNGTPMHILLPASIELENVGLVTINDSVADGYTKERLQTEVQLTIKNNIRYNGGDYTQYDINGLTLYSTYVLVNYKQY